LTPILLLGDHRGMKTLLILAISSLVCLPAFTSSAADTETKDLRLYYQQHCAGCHGSDGAALSSEGKRLKGEDFTAAGFRKDTDDAGMVNVILKGKFFGLAMPAFKNDLSKEEALRMVTEILRKSEKGKVIQSDAIPVPQAK
jgi:mono/diheme cytochrome c family protein